MNETEAQELYQKIFSPDRIERWQSWEGDGNTAPGVQASSTHPLAEVSKTKWRWKHGVTYYQGYRMIRIPDHPRASVGKGKYVMEHILVVEIVLGRFLPIESVVHHFNEIKDDNRRVNLLVCQNQAYHQELHGRLIALKECGNPDWMKCVVCKQWDDPRNMYVWRRERSGIVRAFKTSRHKTCHAVHQRGLYHTRKLRLQLPAQGV